MCIAFGAAQDGQSFGQVYLRIKVQYLNTEYVKIQAVSTGAATFTKSQGCEEIKSPSTNLYFWP